MVAFVGIRRECLVLVSSRAMCAICVSGRQLRAFVQCACSRLRLRLSHVVGTRFTSLLVRLKGYFVGGRRASLEVAIYLLRVRRHGTYGRYSVFEILSLSSKIATYRVVSYVFTSVSVLVFRLFVRARDRVVAMVRVLFRLLAVLTWKSYVFLLQERRLLDRALSVFFVLLVGLVLTGAWLAFGSMIVRRFTI